MASPVKRSFLYLHEVLERIDRIAPSRLAAKWDNVGLLVDGLAPTAHVARIFLTIDLTEAVLDEAIQHNANLIVAYHPIIFPKVASLRQTYWKSRVAIRAIQNNISVFCPHTAFDAMHGGINDWLASLVSTPETLLRVSPIVPAQASANKNEGDGRILELKTPVPCDAVVAQVKQGLRLERLRFSPALHSQTPENLVTRIAICAGSGASLLKQASADLYLTGEMAHHEILDAVHSATNVVLTEHTNCERGFLPVFKAMLETSLAETGHSADILVSTADKDPIQIV